MAATPRGQAAFGHKGTVVADGCFHKLASTSGGRFDNEKSFLTLLEAERDTDPMAQFVPAFHGVAELNGKTYLKMENLLAAFDAPRLMDIKMGVRCFEESELSSTKPRADLFERLAGMEAQLAEPASTAEEREAGSITKARWMGIRDSMSSTQSLGFRVDAVLTPTEHLSAFTSHLWHTRAEADVIATLRSFLPAAAECAPGVKPREMAVQIGARLAALRAALPRSAAFGSHEFIGSTLLFVADLTGRCGVSMIDFGVTTAAPGGSLRHDVPWEAGNHEDGYLTGLANLERLWGEMVSGSTWD